MIMHKESENSSFGPESDRDGRSIDAQEVLLLYVLPFAYGGATRVPFVFAALHCISVLGGSMSGVSLMLASYQSSRILGNYSVKLLGPHRSLPCGAMLGLCGYTLVLVTALSVSTASTDGRLSAYLLCIAGLGLIGLSEQIAALQDLCKVRYMHCSTLARSKLLKQYASNTCGTCFAFLFSGLMYHQNGLLGAACLGAALELVLFLGSRWYLSADTQHRAKVSLHKNSGKSRALSSAPVNLSDTDSNGAVSKPQLHAECGVSGICRHCMEHQDEDLLHPSDASMTNISLSDDGDGLLTMDSITFVRTGSYCARPDLATRSETELDSSCVVQLRRGSSLQRAFLASNVRQRHEGQQFEQPHSQQDVLYEGASTRTNSASSVAPEADRPTWISYVLAATFCWQAVLIGTVLSTAPLLISSTMGLGVLHVGLTFALGEALGSITLLYLSSTAGQDLVRRVLPSPLCMLVVLTAMSVMATSCALFRSSWFRLSCLVGIMWLNDVGTSMCGECQGAIQPARHYRSMNLLGNVLRRLGNTLTCTVGPIIFQYSPTAPLLIFGLLLLAWVGLLCVLFAVRAGQLDNPEDTKLVHPAGGTLQHQSKATHKGQCRDRTGGYCRHLVGTIAYLKKYRELSFISREQKLWQHMGVGNRKHCAEIKSR